MCVQLNYVKHLFYIMLSIGLTICNLTALIFELD